MQMVHGSVKRKWANDLNISIEKIAMLRDVSLRRGTQGFLTLVAGVCGIFLFSTMEAKNHDENSIIIVAFIGLGALLVSLLSETFTMLKAQRQKEGQVKDREQTKALATIMIENRGKRLMLGQQATFERCIEPSRDEEGWAVLKSPSPEVDMWIKYIPSKIKGKRSFATGKATGVVDCSAEEVAA